MWRVFLEITFAGRCLLLDGLCARQHVQQHVNGTSARQLPKQSAVKLVVKNGSGVDFSLGDLAGAYFVLMGVGMPISFFWVKYSRLKNGKDFV